MTKHAYVHSTLPTSACCQIQISNVTWGVGMGCAPRRAGHPLTSSPWYVCKGGHGAYFPWDCAGHATILPAFISVIPEHLFVKTGDNPRGLYSSPYSWTGHGPGIQPGFNTVLIILKREGTVRRQTVPLTTFPENTVLFAWCGNN